MLGRIVVFALMVMDVAGSTVAATTHDFYKGKTVLILVGASAGGACDTWGRMLGRHLGKQIPGNRKW